MARKWRNREYHGLIQTSTPRKEVRKTNEILQHALYYAGLGWPVFPVNLDKTPATKNGFKDATTDPEIIKTWFTNTSYNLAVRTGEESGIIVVDIDDEDAFQGLVLIYGDLPMTVEQTTGRGRQLFFKHPLTKLKGKACQGVDIKDRGYVVVAPSIHSNGKKYAWKPGQAPGETPFAELPPWWIGSLTGENKKTKTAPQTFQIDGVTIPEGSRNQTLFRLGCSYREKGLNDSVIWDMLQSTNDHQCEIPLEESELRTIFKSVLGYSPGQLSIATNAKSDFSTPPARAKVICLDDVEAEEVEWLWFPYIPLGKLTLMQGDPGDGKTTVILNIAANITTGRALPGAEPTEPGNIIYQTAEDGIADTIKPRLISAVADCKRVFVIDESEKGLSLSDERIEAAMIDYKPKLFIIDPLQAYLGGDIDMHRANQVRPVLKKVGMLAEKYGCAVIMIMHLSKGSQNRSLYRGLGSVDIPAAARSVLLVGKNPNNQQERAMAQVKNSLAPMGSSLGFEITQFGVLWKGVSELTAEDLLGPVYKADDSNDEERKSPIREARRYLIDCLKDGPGLGKEIIDGIKYAGFSKRTLDTAKAQLKIVNTWEGRECYWAFPPDENWEFPPDAKVDEP